MNKQQPLHKQRPRLHRDSKQLAREKALFRYSNALDRGDFDTIATILHQAEQDAVLEQMIIEMNEFYQSESDAQVRTDDAAFVRELIRQHLPLNPDTDEEMVEAPRLTVRDVINRLRTDLAQKNRSNQEVTRVDQQLQQSNIPLPEDLNIKRVSQLFEQMGIAVSKPFQKLFRQTAIFLSMGREQGMTLAATRRQRRGVPKSDSLTDEEES